MKRVLLIGASSPLGHMLCSEFQRQGWYVIALVRKTSRAKLLAADQLVEARFADPNALSGVMTGVTLVVSCLGTKREADAVDGWHIDYPSKLNLLQEAKRASVEQFICVDQLHGLSKMQVMDALDLDAVAGPQRQQDQFENTCANIPTAQIHQLITEREKS
ncbi:NAD(P)H-binding protein [Yoonia sp. R2331]|uniref:NAD(P)H-binding protein n=1 Tax=Yoonia sp. R2331 TaxID=3237238 RepID=UPI0034E53980